MDETEPLDELERLTLAAREGPELRADREKLADKSHPGFDIECRHCGAKSVVVESSMGYSPEFGGWGSVDLKCLRCGSQEPIYE
jgi:hypothetical protein